MKFKLTMSANWVSEGAKKDYEILGFKFQYDKDAPHKSEPWYVSCSDASIDIYSIEQLMEFSKKFGQLILFSSSINQEPSIEIYNDYRE